MNLQLHPDQLRSLAGQLAKARRREIGGVLVGEHMSHDLFRLVDLSFQRAGGTETCFVRRPEQHEEFFQSFFERTRRDFERFNYIGEWHSHPTYSAYPSAVDHDQMQAIVEDDELTAPTFAILIIARLATNAAVELSATAYRRNLNASPVTVEIVPRPTYDPVQAAPPWWRRALTREPRKISLTCVQTVASGGPQGHRENHGGEYEREI